jgi:NAD(P)-dependent dehydrogenase (short-subunit alcohol dehydrogenase family)
MIERHFQDRVVVVTGAASGIGFATAQRFAEQGTRVALLDLNQDRGREAAKEIKSAGGICEFYLTDVSVEADVIKTFEKVAASFHGVDHLVNNAGMVLVKGIEECTVEEWDLVINVNLRSIFLTTKYALPSLRSSSHPTIVNVGSVSSFIAQKGTPAYVASKGGAFMLSRALALDLSRYGIRVNCVCPGITDTPMFRFHVNSTADPERTLRERFDRVPLGRPLSPREIADAILYLSSDQASGITGTSLVVDAGYTAACEWSREQ